MSKESIAEVVTDTVAAPEVTQPVVEKNEALAGSAEVAALTPKSKAEKAPKAKKLVVKKPKLVRDSFTIPESDYVLFSTLKQRAITAGVEVKKSELLRASLSMLAKLDDAAFKQAIDEVERIKTGRPKK